VDLPVMPPVLPMLAKSVKGIPDPAKFDGLSFEPKWDGFRCIVFRTATRSSWPAATPSR
jgi:ATP-dependent DNA ligase